MQLALIVEATAWTVYQALHHVPVLVTDDQSNLIFILRPSVALPTSACVVHLTS